MPLFIYFFLYSFHIGILCTYFLRSCYMLGYISNFVLSTASSFIFHSSHKIKYYI
ncbi:hypothetical protein [Orientia tsutsugamushi]|uniref:hypothetical protein n=1 Tax=Orientia tsutsugamushi TaxID=784 RepID=UPI000A4760C7|nr:hypothetical protein [Orientia tsutsugamushi]